MKLLPQTADKPLFGRFVTDPPMRRKLGAIEISLLVHGVAISLLVLVPILWPEPLPEYANPVRAFLLGPPPPPAPLMRGSALLEKKEEVRPVTPEQKPEPTLAVPTDPKDVELKPEAGKPEQEQFGDPYGSSVGVPDGMEDGVEGGQVGGVPDGVVGGVIGGTGDIVSDYDQPPRLIRQMRPEYPQGAFIKKIEGTVEVEFIIDVDGHVRRAWIVRSVPLLDAAAIRTVLQWVFTPAVKYGRPVATKARAPVEFRIY